MSILPSPALQLSWWICFLSCFIKQNKTRVSRALLPLILKMRGENTCWKSERMSERFLSLFCVFKTDFIFFLMSFYAWNGSLKKADVAIPWIQASTLASRYCTEHPVDTTFISRVFGSIVFFCARLSFVSNSWKTELQLSHWFPENPSHTCDTV